jgi:hypothetical protein
MERFSKHDVREIIDMLENQLIIIRKMNKTEKMNMLSRIREQRHWLLALRNPTSGRVSEKLEERLSDLFSVCTYGFSEKLKELLEIKIKLTQLKKDNVSVNLILDNINIPA